MASSSIVIKVKYGETLRRLNASVNDRKLVLDMVMLKEKIRSLFSFGSDVDFTMTYVDEDGDVVTLADDGDLIDVARQSLNPLRITVNLKSTSCNGPSGNLTPLRSAQNQHQFQSLNDGVSEILKSIPEPLLEALAKLPLDLAAKASSSSPPAVAELVEKMKDVYSSQILPKVHSNVGGSSNLNSEPSTVEKKVKPEAGSLNLKKKEKQVQKKKEKPVQKVSEGVDINVPHSEYGSFQAPVCSTKSVGEGSTGRNKDTTNGVAKKKFSSFKKNDGITGGSYNGPLKHDTSLEHMNQVRQNLTNEWQQTQDLLAAQKPQTAQLAADTNKNTYDFCSSSGWVQKKWNATNQSPYSANVFHRGIICDGCEVHPITGPRFKSKVKIDYDLCYSCFVKMGNPADYIRMDHPTNSFGHPPVPFKGIYDTNSFGHPSGNFMGFDPFIWAPKSKLNSMFIADVNVRDKTIMAPLTAFTKTWRMGNNGSINWPYGSKLQLIGGNILCKSVSVIAKVPVDGLPVNKEVDISVDFTAPALPGQYASYWRMSSPSGQKFGQEVWVLIQVDASMKNTGNTSIDLNLPVNQDHPVDNIFSENTSANLPPKDQDMKIPVNDSKVIEKDGVSSTMGIASGLDSVGPTVTTRLDSEPVSYPTVDSSVMPPVMSDGSASAPTVVVQPPPGSGKVVSDDQEQSLVKDLEAMGFKNLDLNMEMLRTNNYDLDKSVDALSDDLEWDPMLDELREMGFADDEVNRRLLKKNNGSIKGVVMDLIYEENA